VDLRPMVVRIGAMVKVDVNEGRKPNPEIRNKPEGRNPNRNIRPLLAFGF
jgi:hypothetical protein